MAISSLGLFGVPRSATVDIGNKVGVTLDAADWDSGRVLQTLEPGNVFTTLSLPPGLHIIMAKAKDTSGNYSENVAKIEFEVINQNDLVTTLAQAPDWSGSKSGFVRHELTGTLIPESKSLASSLGFDVFDLFVADPVDLSVYIAPDQDLGADFDGLRVWATITSRLGPGEEDSFDPVYAVDHHDTTGNFDGFEPWTIGKISARYIRHRLTLDNTAGTVFLRAFIPVVDAVAREENFASLTIAPGGTVITFAKPFINLPLITITPSSPLKPWWELKSTTSVKVHLSNSADTDVGGVADVKARGV